jgi:predicted component of type VI protein secretion system
MAKVKAKPLTNPEPNQNKAPQAIKVVTLLSRILEKAR